MVDASHAECAELFQHTFGRRRLLALGAGALGLGALATTFPGVASAQPPYEAMLLMCIDPRFVQPTNEYMQQRDLTHDYSQFALAGAAAGVVAPAFETWHSIFWDNLDVSIELHQINAVIAIDHRDCSAVKIAYGSESVSTPERETATHEMILGAFRDGVMQRHPELSIEGWLMALDGSMLRII
jgi:Putative carbonic anhydrase